MGFQLTYWIVARFDQRKKLENLGVDIGGYNYREGCFENCWCDSKALTLLNTKQYVYGAELQYE